MQTPPTPPEGLSSDEARRRLAAHGPNALADRDRHSFVQTLRGIVTEPMFLLLVLAAALYLVLGDLGEGLLLAFFALVTVGLVVFQERRSEQALRALRDLAVPQVRVRRDGAWQRIPARELVPGDLFAVGEGERVAADGLLHEASAVAVDESLLTGESVPVDKRAGMAETAAGDDGDTPSSRVFAGTLVVSGHGVAEATATGAATQMGRIGASLAAIDVAATPLQQQLRGIVRVFGLAALAASTLLVVWYGLQRGDWMQGLLSAIALGMAMLPEEFPMALAVFLALGAWRLAKLQVLARRPAVIEALGAATVLCVDKTGTLTENRMRLARLVTAEADVDASADTLPEAVHALLEAAVLASRRDSADPMDRAVLARADTSLAGTEHLHPQWLLEREYPLTPELLALSHAWVDEQGRRCIAAKGAPEAVADLCHLDAAAHAALITRVHALAAQGLRVLAVARGAIAAGDGAADTAHEHDFTLLGLLGFEDPLRPGVPAAVAEARGAGIAVAMITGDHAATARAIARQAGLDVDAGVLTGRELEALDDAALAQAVRQVRVFARVSPVQKLRLVQALQGNGETVAMTGDGVNDAPALKAAHVGIAMGVRGTDVAREAAGLVLLDEDFGRIVGGVRMGRRIFDNLRRVMTYITAIHVPIAGLALLPVLFGLPPLMLPAHVVLTEMVIDPVCSLAFEGAPEDPRLMKRPPRRAGDSIVGWPVLWRGLVQGALLLVATLVVYLVALDAGRGDAVARTLAVVGLTAGNLLLVALNLADGHGLAALTGPSGRAFRAVTVVAAAVLAVGVLLPGPRELLRFGLPGAADLGLTFALVALACGIAALATRRRVA
jgi:Ca2+-transporting ATPase